jgi:hypothetical protein
MNDAKVDFLKNRFIPLLEKTPFDTKPSWGKMTLQQMIEHFADAVRIASGKMVFKDILTPEPTLQKMREFIMTDHPFRENTKNPLLPEVPAPVRNPSLEAAIAELRTELKLFFSVFEKNNLQVTRNPLFGDLNYDQNVSLLYKHALHHLKQFGVEGVRAGS